jgi:(p)ppGpp synthase/HD superfamily hydrolase
MRIIRSYIYQILKEQDITPVEATAQYAHQGQTRRSGEPYFSHPYEVAELIKQYYPSNDIAYNAALLHDTIEDAIDAGNVADEEEMIALINDAIEDPDLAASVISVVLALTKAKWTNYQVYLSALFEFPNALIVKLADMNHNLGDDPSERQKIKYSEAVQNIKEYFGGKPEFINKKHWEILLNKIKPEAK